MCSDSTGKKNTQSEKTKNKDVTFIVLQKNMRLMHSSERIEEMVCEFEGYRWDAMFLSETWRQGKSEIWETHHKHTHGSRKVRQQTRCWNYAEQEMEAKNY